MNIKFKDLKSDFRLLADFHGFESKRLKVEGREELEVFPLKIYFILRHVEKNGTVFSADAIYSPDLSSFAAVVYGDNGLCRQLRYYNEQNHDYWLEITTDGAINKYICGKYHEDNKLGQARGSDWEEFFTKVTLLGIEQEEDCSIYPIDILADMIEKIL